MMPRRTPLYRKHAALNAKLIDFGGFDMPLHYSSIKREHNAVRTSAGLFDVSHMGEFIISGPAALQFIQKITINDASKLQPGKAQYSAMCYEDGGIVDDLIVYMLDEQKYMFVVNASNIAKDREWILSHNSFGADFEDISEKTALLALQGPNSVDLLQKLTKLNPQDIPFYTFAIGEVAGEQDVIISATGYTGEKGFELYINTEIADPAAIWEALLDHGAEYNLEPAGLGARDTLRLEMGYALYGNDITGETTPLEGGLGWLIGQDKGDFIGSDAIRRQKEEGLKRKLTGFIVHESRQIPRSGYEIFDETLNKIGFITSGSQSITLGKGIGMGYIETGKVAEGSPIQIAVRKKKVPAVITKPPFINK